MPKAETVEHRLAEVEIELTYQHQTIETLNGTIAEQWKIIDGLKVDLKRLKDQLQSMEARMPSDGPEPPPPHY
ncbi:MAG: SlyX family protein [Alphaproteobacteria bacterium]|nr:MAG: SlyX family protein [Alphaproteobacteria bacterium]